MYFCAYPIEYEAGCQNGVISGEGAKDLYRFYAACGLRSPEKTAISDSPYVCVTEHVKTGDERILAVMNYTPEERAAEISCGGYSLVKAVTIHGGSASDNGGGVSVRLPGNAGMILTVKRNET